MSDPLAEAIAQVLRPIVREAVADALAELDASETLASALLTRTELAEALGCSLPMVDKLRRQGMPCEVRLGDSPRWPRDEVPQIIGWLRDRGGG